MMKRLCALLTALVLVLTAAVTLADEAQADALLVTVNGKEIRENDPELSFWINYLNSQIDEGTEVDQAMLNQYAMDYCIRYTLLAQETEKLGQGITAEENAAFEATAQTSWESAVASVMQNAFGIAEDASEEDKAAGRADTIDYIKTNYGYTEESYKAEEVTYYRLMTYSERFTDLVSKDIEVTDEDVQTYFNGMVDESREIVGDDAGAYEFYKNYYGYDLKYMPEGYRGISHILLAVDEDLLKTWTDLAEKLSAQENPEEAAETTETEAGEAAPEAAAEATEEPVTQEMVDAAKQAILDSVKDKIDEITAKLEAGASFEDLIVEYGTDTGMQSEENRTNGYAVHANSIMYNSDFQEGAMKLAAIGDISEPVVSSFGVHILKYVRDIPGGAEELTDATKEEIRATIMNERVNEKTGTWINQAMADAEIVWTEAGEDWKLAEEEAAAEETAEAAEPAAE